MRICAIVLNFRDAVRTEACVLSLVGQGLNTVLVVDNSADDRAASELAAMLERQAGRMDCALHLLKPEGNLGFARGVNLALGDEAASLCDAFLLINNDAVAMPGMVAQLASALADSGGLMVAPTVIDAGQNLQPIFWYQRFFGLLTPYSLPGSFPYLSGCCMLLRRDLLVDGKLFDEDFFMYGEDTLLGWQLVMSKQKLLCLGDTFVRHDAVGAGRGGQLFYEYHMARAHILLAMKTRRSAIELPLLLICKYSVLCLRALWRSLRFGSVVPFKAVLMAWRPRDIRVS